MRDKRTPKELNGMGNVVVREMKFKRANDIMF